MTSDNDDDDEPDERRYILTPEHEVREPRTDEEWLDDGKDWNISTTLNDGRLVFTAFLGVIGGYEIADDGTPLLFETAIYLGVGILHDAEGNLDDGVLVGRAATWAEAKALHDKTVQKENKRAAKGHDA